MSKNRLRQLRRQRQILATSVEILRDHQYPDTAEGVQRLIDTLSRQIQEEESGGR